MKYSAIIIFLMININSNGQKNWGDAARAVLTSTFLNKNVYKTKGYLVVTKVAWQNRPATDLRQFTIMPNGTMPSITITKITVKTTPPVTATAGVPASPEKITTTTEIFNIPSNSSNPANTVSSSISVVTSVVPPPTDTKTTITTNYSVPAQLSSKNFIRYKVLYEDADYKYIKLLPGCQFSGVLPTDTIIQYGKPGTDDPKDYVYQVSKKNLTPMNHYLANSVLVGKIVSIPARFRKEYWNDNNKIIQGTLSLGYCFGWKHKIGNNPYNATYINVTLLGLGINQQKYVNIAGKYTVSQKDSLSAKTDEFAVTYLTLGVALEWEKFNIGIFWGKDKMFGKLKNWVYQDKWWWGIGIGYELFK